MGKGRTTREHSSSAPVIDFSKWRAARSMNHQSVILAGIFAQPVGAFEISVFKDMLTGFSGHFA